MTTRGSRLPGFLRWLGIFARLVDRRDRKRRKPIIGAVDRLHYPGVEAWRRRRRGMVRRNQSLTIGIRRSRILTPELERRLEDEGDWKERERLEQLDRARGLRPNRARGLWP